MSYAKDPFTIAYQSLWTILEASEEFCALVPLRNRIHYVADASDAVNPSRQPEKYGLEPSDYPEVKIEAEGGVATIHETSDGTQILKTFTITLLTGDKRMRWVDRNGLAHGIWPLQWAALKALMNWETHVAALTYAGHRFIYGLELQLGTEYIDRADDSAGRQHRKDGWAVKWRGTVQMGFTSADIA